MASYDSLEEALVEAVLSSDYMKDAIKDYVKDEVCDLDADDLNLDIEDEARKAVEAYGIQRIVDEAVQDYFNVENESLRDQIKQLNNTVEFLRTEIKAIDGRFSLIQNSIRDLSRLTENTRNTLRRIPIIKRWFGGRVI